MVMATQNPLEQEGTYQLPEAQLDRFLFKVLLDYPSPEDELELLSRWGQVTSKPKVDVTSSGEELLGLRSQVDAVHVAESVRTYIITLVRKTRSLATGVGRVSVSSEKLLSYGASPRAGLALYQASKALAWLRGSDFVTPDFVQEILPDVMRHRVGLTYEAESQNLTPDRILQDIVKSTPVPASTKA
jgi:MoxR-like ATPase